jgi:hypothetical protein
VARLAQKLYVTTLVVKRVPVYVMPLCCEVLTSLAFKIINDGIEPGCLIPTGCDRVVTETPLKPIVRAFPETATAVA